MKISLPGKITLVFISIIISITITEILLRVFEIKPWENIIINKPQIFKPDTALGWKAKKGNYIIPPLHQLGKKFNMSFDEDGQRKTGESNNKVEGEILVIGGSFAQGWGVSDESTFSSKLQKKYTNFKVYNFGHGGYGSIQSFLLLEEQIPKLKSPKKITTILFFFLILLLQATPVAIGRVLPTIGTADIKPALRSNKCIDPPKPLAHPVFFP